MSGRKSARFYGKLSIHGPARRYLNANFCRFAESWAALTADRGSGRLVATTKEPRAPPETEHGKAKRGPRAPVFVSKDGPATVVVDDAQRVTVSHQAKWEDGRRTKRQVRRRPATRAFTPSRERGEALSTVAWALPATPPSSNDAARVFTPTLRICKAGFFVAFAT